MPGFAEDANVNHHTHPKQSDSPYRHDNCSGVGERSIADLLKSLRKTAE